MISRYLRHLEGRYLSSRSWYVLAYLDKIANLIANLWHESICKFQTLINGLRNFFYVDFHSQTKVDKPPENSN